MLLSMKPRFHTLSACILRHYRSLKRHLSTGTITELSHYPSRIYPRSPLLSLKSCYPSTWTLPDLVPTQSLEEIKKIQQAVPKYQIYISTSTNPYLNLSIEHYLFTYHYLEKYEEKSEGGIVENKQRKDVNNSPTRATRKKTLFFYVNCPCVVIGRNQNLWREVNVPMLSACDRKAVVELVRRRSGGGTVYHDLGNVNYSAITSARVFDRDKHARIVVNALKKLGVLGVWLNERHDIVVSSLSLPPLSRKEDRDVNALSSQSHAPDSALYGMKKISGSAYKIARHSAYHHGTMLLGTELHDLGGLLRSRAKEEGLIEGRGVESVRSEVCNVPGVSIEEFVREVAKEWAVYYQVPGAGCDNLDIWDIGTRRNNKSYSFLEKTEDGEIGDQDLAICYVGDKEGEIEEIKTGMLELMSPVWKFSQTPMFTFSIPIPLKILPSFLPPFPSSNSSSAPESIKRSYQQLSTLPSLSINVQKGIIDHMQYSPPEDTVELLDLNDYIPNTLIGKRFDGRTVAEGILNHVRTIRGNDVDDEVEKWVEALGRDIIGYADEWGIE